MENRAILHLACLITTVMIVGCDNSTSKNLNSSKTNSTARPAGELSVQITAPGDNASVDWRPTVEGKVSSPSATVWVIVHPVNSGGYWVQPSVGVGGDGKWRVQIYCGRAPDADVDVHFDIMAVAQPKANLKEGDVLSAWPTAEAKSQIIDVIRK